MGENQRVKQTEQRDRQEDNNTKQAKAQHKKQAKGNRKSKGFGIREQMMLKLLPTVIATTMVLTIVSAYNGRNIIENQIQETMTAELKANSVLIDGDLELVRSECVNLAREVGMHYQSTPMDVFGNSFSGAVASSDMISGAGIWFEPYAYDAGSEYMGPYWSEENGTVVETYEYSNAEYDYFSQEYYVNAKNAAENEAVITNPYYDEA
ncbi:MAG: cache domain-containing protein [Lachnospiraceae bacterium]|nr:cache domain-containing protein [Lachnospiraceae bacterium]